MGGLILVPLGLLGSLQEMLELSTAYNKALEEEKTMTNEQKALKNVGKQVK